MRSDTGFKPIADETAPKRNTNLSRAAARGLSEEIAEKRAAQWLEENRDAISDWNKYVEEHGLPLARFRQF